MFPSDRSLHRRDSKFFPHKSRNSTVPSVKSSSMGSNKKKATCKGRSTSREKLKEKLTEQLNQKLKQNDRQKGILSSLRQMGLPKRRCINSRVWQHHSEFQQQRRSSGHFA
mmetsp:Transcript_18137/g.38774  ORF Transcript_18137/g.38774 Transcript_18137/m.38774 type:complete len:111 (+) Transcript_18137:5321-5653(+)